MKFRSFLMALCVFMLAVGQVHGALAQTQKTWFVKINEAGPGNGTSWSTAFSSLQSALAAASSGDSIWVAAGTYYPDAADRTKSFNLKENVAVYGGFSGNETALKQRDIQKNTTILSGNIGNGNKEKNTVTIVMGATNAVLDGFTVRDSYSTGTEKMHLVQNDILKGNMQVGGGLRNYMTAPTIRNCIFTNNYSPKGGGAYNVQDPAAEQAKFINCAFVNNVAQIRGGAVSNDLGAMPRFINCVFKNNESGDKGGGMYNDFAASPILFNCDFQNNKAVMAGGMGNDGGAAPLLVHVTVTNNTATCGLGDDLYQGTGVNNNPIAVNSQIGKIYNWHEDIVAVLKSVAPGRQSVALEKFLPISNLSGKISPADFKNSPNIKAGYQMALDGQTLFENPLVSKLLSIYTMTNGAILKLDKYASKELTRVETNPQPSIIYVAPATTSPIQDGTSWERPITDLQVAIDAAAQRKATLWIKTGTYAPVQKDEKIAAFVLYDNITLMGGFSGSETDPSQRAKGNATIISAKTRQGAFRYPHVLYGANNVTLDGLQISDGYAQGISYHGKGGGLMAYHAGKIFYPHDSAVGFAMTIKNCRFVNNAASEGGAIYAYGKAKIEITNTSFENNTAQYGGALMDREGNQFSIADCAFINNAASIDGGAVYADYGSHETISGSTFSGNSAKGHGGAIYIISRASQLEGTNVSISGGAFRNNIASQGADILNLDKSTLTISGFTPANGTIDGAWEPAEPATKTQ